MKMFIASQETSPQKNFIWNMIGSMCNALSSMILLSLVTRCAGSTDGGVFSLAFSTAQLLQTIGCFETRVIQATDVNEDVSFKTYFWFRILTSLLMMIGALCYVVYSAFSIDKAISVLLICLYKAIDAISDSFQGLFQQKFRIDISGQSLGTRVIASTITFAVAIFVSNNLIVSTILMILTEIIWIFLFDVSNSRFFINYDSKTNLQDFKKLFVTCLPLCLGSFMISYILNAPKYAIDIYWGDIIQNIYAFLVMPAFVINLFSLFVFRPLLTTLSLRWNNKQLRESALIIIKCSLWVLFLTVCAMIGAYLLGILILNLLSGLDLTEYKIDLVIIMFGGGINAFIMLFYNVLVVMKKQNIVFFGYFLGFLVSLFLSPILVSQYQIRGATISYVIPMAIVSIVFMSTIFIQFKKGERDI